MQSSPSGLGSQKLLDATGPVTFVPPQKPAMDTTTSRVPFLYPHELRLIEDAPSGHPTVKLLSFECYDTSSDCKKELLDCKRLSVQAQINPEFKMSVEGQTHVAFPTAESEVKQPIPGSDAASDSESVGEFVVPENKFEPISQPDVLDTRTENERFIPAAAE